MTTPSGNPAETGSGDRVALVTGVGRVAGIGHAIAEELRSDGWRVVTTGWRVYDERMPWGPDEEPCADLEADLADPVAAGGLVARARRLAGHVSALICCHCESVDSSIRSTTLESFDRHMAVNARATWLLVKSFAEQFEGPAGTGRIVALTSDHTSFNLPYGASKGALDRIVLAAAVELADLGITANVVNPGPTDTGWMDDRVAAAVLEGNLQPRLGTPADCARLVRFLCSPDGRWVNGQLLVSDGGRRH